MRIGKFEITNANVDAGILIGWTGWIESNQTVDQLTRNGNNETTSLSKEWNISKKNSRKHKISASSSFVEKDYDHDMGKRQCS